VEASWRQLVEPRPAPPAAGQEAVLLLHRTRYLLIRQGSSLTSALRAHFVEFSVVVGQRLRNIDRLLGLLGLLGLLVAEGTALPELTRRMLAVPADQLRDVAARVAAVEGS
jgi:transposase